MPKSSTKRALPHSSSPKQEKSSSSTGPHASAPAATSSSVPAAPTSATTPRKGSTSSAQGDREAWTPERRRAAVEMLIEAGYAHVDFDEMSRRTGLTKQQLRDALKSRPEGRTNFRTKIITLATSI